ncbi:MAG: glycosyltransferase family 4 protein [Anaerolineae bacterium]|nr:glycosyltransferase family 4 protein [Anaerolineae bacterium]
MNLLMLSGDSSAAQGQDSTFSQMLRRFSTHWDRVDVICPHAPGTAPRVLHDNVVVHPSPWHKLFQSRFIVQRGRSLFAERDYALVVSHDFGLFYNGRGARRLVRGTGVPFVSEIHHVEGYPRAVTLRERVYRALAFRYIRDVWRRAAAIRVVNAVEMPALLRRLGVPEDNILVLPSLYLDFEVFRPMPGELRRCAVLFVGRLAPNKGLFTILDAVAQVRATHPGVTLGILGRGPLRSRLEKRIHALNLNQHVTFFPRQDSAADVARLYNQAGMLVCASTAEGGPRVTIEAMACGVPVITTPVGVMAELMHHGANMLVFHWRADELAGNIRQLLDDEALRQRVANQGREAVQGFEAGRIIDRYAQGYHDLIRRLKE